MSYTKTTWQNDQAPAINATNLNKIEQGIFDNDAGITNLLQEIGINTNTWVSTNTYSLGDVVVYNKKLYKNITGSYTTTNPSDDTTNWNEIQIINNNGKLNKSLIPYFNNLISNATDEGYSCDYINNCNTYSTTEVDTGKKWIDGKKIYRKVIDYTGSVGTNNGDNTDIGEITNLEKVIDYSAMIKTGNTVEDHLYISYAYNDISTNQWQCYRVYIDEPSKKVRFNTQRGSSTSPRTIDEIIVIVEYTKTTN